MNLTETKTERGMLSTAELFGRLSSVLLDCRCGSSCLSGLGRYFVSVPSAEADRDVS